jgi:uncharacterized protein GlcG (DUF336 family)
MHVTYEQAEQIIVAAINKAKETGVPSCVAVVDSGANSVLHYAGCNVMAVRICEKNENDRYRSAHE